LEEASIKFGGLISRNLIWPYLRNGRCSSVRKATEGASLEMKTPILVEDNRAARRAQQSNMKSTGKRLGYRLREWAELTGTSRTHTWRSIGALKVVDYNGVLLVPDSERVRLGFEEA
jgi:hypothetical protein